MSKDETPRPKFFTSGWRQFLNSKIDLLRSFDSAKAQSRSHEVEAFHGRVAEAEFRKWLSDFLPKKYGVTSGYIISPEIKSIEAKLPHFDVIIYDVLEAPILWVESSPDLSPQGRSRAIPVEYIYCVFEVKSLLTTRSTSEALEHLSDLMPFMQNVNQAGNRERECLPSRFCCGLVFFELKRDHEYSKSILSKVLAGMALRGFIGGIVFKGEGISEDQTGKIECGISESPIKTTAKRGEDSLLMPSNCAIGEFKQVYLGKYIGSSMSWNRNSFADFAFSLVDRLQGRYMDGRRSNWYGFVGADYIGDTPQVSFSIKSEPDESV